MGQNGEARRIAAQLHFLLIQSCADDRQKFFGDGLVHKQRFHGIAHGGALDLGVHRDFLGHLQVGFGIHINMTNALVMFDDRHLRGFSDRADQAFAATGHAQIHVLRQRKQLAYRFTVGGGHDLDGVLRETGETLPGSGIIMICAVASVGI